MAAIVVIIILMVRNSDCTPVSGHMESLYDWSLSFNYNWLEVHEGLYMEESYFVLIDL